MAQVSYAQPLFDYDNDGSVSVTGDIATIGGVAFSVGGDPGNDGVGDPGKPGYQGRYDINNDGTVDVTGDISVLGGSAFQKCGPG